MLSFGAGGSITLEEFMKDYIRVFGILAGGLLLLTFLNCGSRSFETAEGNDHVYYYKLGKAKYNEEKYRKAVKNFEKAIELARKLEQSINANPRYYAGLYQFKGLAYLQLGDTKSAIKDFKKALEISPHYPDAHDGLGHAYTKKKQYDKAKKHFKKEIESGFPRYIGLGNYNLGCLYMRESNNKKAYYSFKKAIELTPKHYDAYLKFGQLLKRMEKYDEAINLYKKAKKEFPDKLQIDYKLGMIFYTTGKLSKAKEKFDKIASEQPNTDIGDKAMDMLETLEN